MMIVDSFRAKYYKFMLNGLMYRHYLILEEKVKLLERENEVQKKYIKRLEISSMESENR